MGIISRSNSYQKTSNSIPIFDHKGIHFMFQVLAFHLREKPENLRFFIKNKGFEEILNLYLPSKGAEYYLNDVASIFMIFLEDNRLQLATIESKVKAYLYKTSKVHKDIPLAQFISYFKDIYVSDNNLLMDVLKKICVIYSNEAGAAIEEKKGKDDSKGIKENSELVSKRFIKLKSDISFSEFYSFSEEKDNSLPNHSKFLSYSPSKLITQVLSILINHIVESYNIEVLTLSDPSATKQERNPYHFFIQILTLISSKYQVLIPFIINHDCKALIPKDSKISFFKSLQGEKTPFIEYYLKAINIAGLDRIRYFLVEIASSSGAILEVNEKIETIGLAISEQILSITRNMLEKETTSESFLETPESI